MTTFPLWAGVVIYFYFSPAYFLEIRFAISSILLFEIFKGVELKFKTEELFIGSKCICACGISKPAMIVPILLHGIANFIAIETSLTKDINRVYSKISISNI